MSHSIRTLVATVLAVGVASWVVPERTAAQQAAQLPPAAQRTGNLPLRDVQSSYTPAGKRVSPQDGLVMQIKPNGQRPRDADGHPDLTGNWVANFPSPMGAGGLRRNGAFEPDQSAMQRAAQWNKPIYKPEFWDKVQELDQWTNKEDPIMTCQPSTRSAR